MTWDMKKTNSFLPYNRSDGYYYASTALFARGVCLSMPIMQCFATLYDAYQTALSIDAKSAFISTCKITFAAVRPHALARSCFARVMRNKTD